MRTVAAAVVAVLSIAASACERAPIEASARQAPPAAPDPWDVATTEAKTESRVVASADPTPDTKVVPVPEPARPAAAPQPERTRAHLPVRRATASRNLPVPPTDEPAAYAAWFATLSPGEQRRIRSACRAKPRTYQFECGGIGPLHIPYPPGPRARVRPDDPQSYFATAADWEASLTAVQRRYIARMCPGNESDPSSDLCGDNTPLVIAFDGEPVELVTGGTFAFAPGMPTATDWPTATTPWLALDRDGNGAIDSGAELFGSDTVLPDGTTAINGFVALAALDANHDGRIDASDPAFASLVLWGDRDGDGRSTPDELRPAAGVVISISLAYRLDPRCDARGNCEGERAAVEWHTPDGTRRTGEVVDIYLPRR